MCPAPPPAPRIASTRFEFTTDLAPAVRASEIVFIAVGTPQDSDGAADLKYVLQVATDVGRAMDDEKIVLTKSTVPVGTADQVRAAIEAETDHPVHVCSNPEFLKEGAAVEDFMKPDRVVLGSAERIGPSFLFPGLGYGGSCFPKDVKALINTFRELGDDGRSLDGLTVAVWGLSFKPKTDDMRRAPTASSSTPSGSSTAAPTSSA